MERYKFLFNFNDLDAKKIFDDKKYAVGKVLFRYNGNEEIVKIPNDVIAIGERAFEFCDSIKEVILGDNVQAIGRGAFTMCASLEKIKLSLRIRWIDYATFAGCKRLKHIEIGKNVNLICPAAFQKSGIETISIDKENEFYTYKDGLLYELKAQNTGQPSHNGKALLWVNENIIGDKLTVPDGVVVIAEGAFGMNQIIHNVILPKSVAIIETGAFACSSLQTCYIPASVRYIGENAFNGCNHLVIECHQDTYTHKYAELNNIKYKIVD